MEETNETEGSQIEETKIEFKKPVLFGRIGKLPKKAKSEPDRPPEPKPIETVQEIGSESSNSKSSLPPAVLLKELSTPIPYKEPKWSGLCPEGSEYSLEVIKSGTIVERVDLNTKPYYVFGRLANCDVVMAHPTISRHHAVLQYKAFAADEEPASGWYLFDLASTHGTFLNKDRVKPSHYTRVRVGHHIKFGTSTRVYIVLGPDFDCEGESDLTVTEIKQRAREMKLDRDRMMSEAMEQRERAKLEEEKRKEDQGIDWGMGEDAEEDPDLSENPYASTGNEELYLEDPKKTLRGYFEREGHELHYDCEEKGPGQFRCRVELPMDDARGRPIVAEVMHRGKKKEAVIACALEACRLLDRAGLLRQAKHESKRRKSRDWSADDYYDSDDDNYLDRTGHVERKRKQRMRRHGAVTEDRSDKPLTYDDLLKQIADIESKISLEEKNLERLRSAHKPIKQSETEDDLDAYMLALGRQGQTMAQKAEISQTKMNIQKMKTELSKARRLSELARPAHLPPLLPAPPTSAVRIGQNSVVYGKRIRLKEDSEKHKKVRKEAKQEETEFVEEMDSDEETQETNEKQEKQQNTQEKQQNTQEKQQNTQEKQQNTQEKQQNTQQETTNNSQENTEFKNNSKSAKDETKADLNEDETAKSKRVFGPMRPPENYVIPDSYFEQETDRDLGNIEESDTV